MMRLVKNLTIGIVFVIMGLLMLGLLSRIIKLEEVNGQLRQIKRQYEQICTRYGGNNCE